MRLFVAINFDKETKRKILNIQDNLRKYATGSFSYYENLHLTLVFLGETDPSRLQRVEDAMQSITIPEMNLIFSHIIYYMLQLQMMQIEKWMTFLILSFILAIALFNVVGSLSMLMIEKQEDVKTLRNMGASDSLISRIFLFEGWMIAGFGALIGILIGIILCLIQQEFGLLKLGQTTGAFIVDAYPVRVALSDVITVFITVVTIGFIAAWYPVHHLGKKWFVR